jgi:hypothetical protein
MPTAFRQGLNQFVRHAPHFSYTAQTHMSTQLSFRFPSVSISGLVVVILTFPVGRAWATYVPEWRVMGLPLNPGPFTVKEHVLITVCISASLAIPSFDCWIDYGP